MKLNLLPATVSTANRARGAIVASVLLILLCAVAAAAMAILSTQRLDAARKREEEALPGAQKAVTVAKQADAAAADPKVRALVTDVGLAKAMLAHNAKYPLLYDSIKPYIPGFFRLTSLSASPIDDKTSTINMQGVIRTYQEYADLMLALLRVPGAVSVGRAGFAGVEKTVPAVVEADQNGRPREAQNPPIPDDPIERLTYFQTLPKPEGYLNVGNFGSGQPGLRTITPNGSLISVQLVVSRDLRVPVPRSTLTALGGAAPAAGLPPGGVAGFGGPPPGAIPGGVPGAGAGGAPAASGRGRAGVEAGD